MDIAQIINQRYPLHLFLPDAQQVRDIALSYSAQARARLEKALYPVLQSLSVHLGTQDFKDQKVFVRLFYEDSAESTVLMECRGCVEKNFRFSDADPIYAVAWTLYAIATSQTWFDKNEYSISVQMFSLEQQLLAGSVLGALNVHRSAEVSEELKKRIKNSMRGTIQKIAAGFASQAPSASFMLVPEAGWKGIGRNLFGNVDDMTRAELLQKLGCGSLEEDLDAFCEYARSTAEYQEQLDREVMRLLRNVRYQPMTDLERAFKSVIAALEKEIYAATDELQMELEVALEVKCSPRNLSARRFADAFEKMETAVHSMAQDKLRAQVYRDFSAAILKKYRQLYEQAVREISEMRKSRICYINFGSVPPQQLNWQELDNIAQADKFEVECESWNDSGGARLADIVQNGYPVPEDFDVLWLCGRECRETLQSLVFNRARVVPGLHKQMLVAYMMKDEER